MILPDLRDFSPLALGVNIDHVATLRNARGGSHPDPIRAAQIAREAKADSITVHLREDRRHITETDIERLKKEVPLALNLEIAPTAEMVALALSYAPKFCCLVPERREELTTEGGLNVLKHQHSLKTRIQDLTQAGIKVSLFVDAEPEQLERAREIGASAIELHTGTYCHAVDKTMALNALRSSARLARSLGLECHAGHGLNFDNVTPIAAIPEISVLNIGHFLIGEALFSGLSDVILRMRRILDQVREKGFG